MEIKLRHSYVLLNAGNCTQLTVSPFLVTGHGKAIKAR